MRKVILTALLALLAAVPSFGRGDKVKYDADGWPIALERKPYFGYRFFIEGAYGMGMTIQTDPFSITLNKQLRYFNAGTTHGFQLGSVFFAGAGAEYMQLVGPAVDTSLPQREILAYGDLRFTFGGMFAGYLDLRPGVAYVWENRAWCFYTAAALGFDVARSFQLGLELNVLPLNIGKPSATPLDTLIGIRAGLSFGRGCRR